MKYIKKSKTSKGYHRLLNLKRQNGTYNDLKNDKSKSDFLRDDVLSSLLQEQGYLCAYCMQKITLQTATIEHIVGQNYKSDMVDGSDYQLEYDNFLAVCSGKSCASTLHCDKSRSKYQYNRPLFADPLKKSIVDNIRYSQTGTIYYKEYQTKEEIKNYKDHTQHSNDSNIQYDLAYVLNLNCHSLKQKRKAVLDGLKKLTKNWSNKERIARLSAKYQAHEKNFTEFFGLIEYQIKKYSKL